MGERGRGSRIGWWVVASLLGVVACWGDDLTAPEADAGEVEFLTASGAVVQMDGTWEACAEAVQGRVNEVFEFSEASLTIRIMGHGTPDCSDAVLWSEVVTITFTTSGTYMADRGDGMVLTNRISGLESTNGAVPAVFKQGFHIDDTVQPMALYHGKFEDDGGTLDAAGYPLELHPVAIVRR